MNAKEYIESGKLENYVLDICFPDEKQEVECMARIFPDVSVELNAIRNSFEKYVVAKSVDPPASLKNKVLAAIEKEEKENSRSGLKVIRMDASQKSGSGKRIRFVAAASVALLLLSVYWIFYLSQQTKSLVSENNTLKDEKEILNDRFAGLVDQLDIVNDPASSRIIMKGTPVSPQSVATIYWNKKSSSVFIAVNSLPGPPEGKQYQLWGIVAGKPVDLGVFDVTTEGDSILQKMKEVADATTFAVTLEKEGGSPTPTLEQMIVAGDI